MTTTSTERIWNEHADRLRGFIRKRVSDPSLAGDLLQEVFLKVQTRVDTLKDETRLQSWLYQIARNTIIDHFRSQRPEQELPETLDLPEPEPPYVLEELAECVRPMLNALPQEYRDALVLSELEGLPQKVVAEKLGISLSAAKSRILRGREQLKAVFVQCCHFDLDHRGGVIGYNPRKDNCRSC